MCVSCNERFHEEGVGLIGFNQDIAYTCIGCLHRQGVFSESFASSSQCAKFYRLFTDKQRVSNRELETLVSSVRGVVPVNLSELPILERALLAAKDWLSRAQ